jgi:hypothetical protein
VLTEPKRDEAQRLFAERGYTPPLRVAAVTSDDEWIFVVTSDTLPATLTAALQQPLHRKVWIVGQGKPWADTEPLRSVRVRATFQTGGAA